eukprot:6485434-Amphidinium_carterae.2
MVVIKSGVVAIGHQQGVCCTLRQSGGNLICNLSEQVRGSIWMQQKLHTGRLLHGATSLMRRAARTINAWRAQGASALNTLREYALLQLTRGNAIP